jgi:hypothetical protein
MDNNRAFSKDGQQPSLSKDKWTTTYPFLKMGNNLAFSKDKWTTT